MQTAFTFAGFNFPRRVAMLPKGRPAARLANIRKAPAPFKVAARSALSTYQTAPKPGVGGAFFYLDSDFMPGLRWQWADDVEGVRIDHTGWWSDRDGAGDSIRGIVLRLPKGRGFLAGWSMGEGMASEVESSVMDDETSAAHRADSLAEQVAEKERERATAYDAGDQWQGEGEVIADARRAALAILKERRTVIYSTDDGAAPVALCAAIRDKVDSLLETIRDAREKRANLASGDADGLEFWTGDSALRAAFNEGAGTEVIPA